MKESDGLIFYADTPAKEQSLRGIGYYISANKIE